MWRKQVRHYAGDTLTLKNSLQIHYKNAVTLVLTVWSRQGENTTEYQHRIQWTLKAVKDREQRLKEAGVDGEAEFKQKKVEKRDKMRETEAERV